MLSARSPLGTKKVDKRKKGKTNMEQQQQPTQPQQPTVEKRDVLGEIASGYLLAATIVSFLGLWAVAISTLQSLPASL